jgi:hypothetical protein
MTADDAVRQPSAKLRQDLAEDTVTATLAEWEALVEGATVGPWEVGDRYHIQGASHCRCSKDVGPLVWEGVRDINGTPMRAHIHRRPQPLGGGEDTSIYGGALPEPVTVALSTSEYVRIAPGNAALIAAARTAMPALLGFVREVRVALAHEACADTCGSQLNEVYPCSCWKSTIERALTERIGGEGRG